MSAKKLYELFCEKYPEYKIGHTRFNDQLKAYKIKIYNPKKDYSPNNDNFQMKIKHSIFE